MGYTNEGVSDAFKHLYGYELTGELSQEGIDYINGIGYENETLPEVPTLETMGGEDFPVYVDDDGYAVLELGPEMASILTGAYFQLAYVDIESDMMIMLGRDNDIDADWDNGVFKDNFRGVWGAIDGNLVYMEIVYEGDDYNTYSVPILLNGEEYNLRVVYDFIDECYYILGARQGLDESGMSDKNLIQLEPGDEIAPILYVSSISGDDDFVSFNSDTFTVTGETCFEEVDLGDGDFVMMFEMEDVRNELAYSEVVIFTVEGDDIYTTV